MAVHEHQNSRSPVAGDGEAGDAKIVVRMIVGQIEADNVVQCFAESAVAKSANLFGGNDRHDSGGFDGALIMQRSCLHLKFR